MSIHMSIRISLSMSRSLEALLAEGQQHRGGVVDVVGQPQPLERFDCREHYEPPRPRSAHVDPEVVDGLCVGCGGVCIKCGGV